MHSHSHDHCHHDHSHAASAAGTRLALGIGLNVAFVAAEIIYGIKADSLSLLADAGHNASDVLGLLLTLAAVLLARRHASSRYTYGWQSASILAALANGLMLLAAVGGIGFEAFHRFRQPEMPATDIVIVVALIGVGINAATAWMLHSGSAHDLNMRSAFLHMAADALISLGVVIAALVIAYTGWLWLDPLVSALIAAIIALSTWKLLAHAMALALHAAPPSINTDEVRQFLSGQAGVAEVHDLHIWAMSTTDIALSAHLLMPGGHPGDGFLARMREQLQQAFHIAHSTIQIEVGDDENARHHGCDLQ